MNPLENKDFNSLPPVFSINDNDEVIMAEQTITGEYFVEQDLNILAMTAIGELVDNYRNRAYYMDRSWVVPIAQTHISQIIEYLQENL